MFLKRLVLVNFRNLEDLSWNPHRGINIITGDNAQGKTNLLEAINFCTSGASFRTSREREMVRQGADFLKINSLMEKNGSQYEISVEMAKDSKLEFKLNGLKQVKNKLFQPGMSVSFTPSDLDLVRGNPAGRRRWMDAELCCFEARYIYNMQNYNRVLTQKNNLLREKIKTSGYNEILETFNTQLADYGSRIIHARLSQLGRLSSMLKNVYRDITSGKEDIYFKYFSSIPLVDKLNLNAIKKSFLDTMMEKNSEEKFKRQSLVGPHRDDLNFFVNNMDARHFCSRGQQRSIVLALKISVINVYRLEYGEYPVLLMDDVLLELDESRQAGMTGLFELPLQVFITSTALPENFPADYRAVKITNGQLT
ncbi:DNA recombination and repair protein RecF [Desulfocucumis palustris]|uniref:DNA replication and repair protein RecF n=1 Tax=Desulfocucumis palustris TaxID=1898651 RepID=A0A2L2XE53_9FIRM|nr:DNA replication/repair protein RecF [Desulfocucumis palustris]GBF32516.1 DNA recombination and repair protein RecF [Desulfocucumis palustris]